MKASNNRLFTYSLLSVLVAGIFLAVSLLAAYSSASQSGEIFIWAYLYTIGRILLLFGGLILFVLRLTIGKKVFASLPYVFAAITNILIGVTAIYLFFFHHYTREFLHDALWNLLMGVILAADILLTGNDRK